MRLSNTRPTAKLVGVIKMNADELKAEMRQCAGTTNYHKLTLTPLLATDGVRMVAEKAGAFWLVDAIGSYQMNPEVKTLAIQFWTLEVEDNKAVLYCTEDTGRPRIVEHEIKYTDFPDGKWKFYVQQGLIMLPEEY